MRALVIGIALVFAGCGAGDAGTYDSPDAMSACSATISFTPAIPVAGPTTEVRAAAIVSSGVLGFQSYAWSVSREGASIPFEDATLDRSEIKFIADQAGAYRVELDVSVPGYNCVGTASTITAVDSSSSRLARLRITPSSGSGVPPSELQIELPDTGTHDLQTISLDAGTTVAGTVTGPSGGVPAYVRFIPIASPDAAVEAFADASGAYSVRLAKVPHDVLVVPGGGFAPTQTTWSPGQLGAFGVGAGAAVSGSVLGPGGAALPGAKVQLFADGVPSTLATTASDGSFSVALDASATQVRVEVVPPQSTGLPRLERTGAFNTSLPIEVRYASLDVEDLAGMVVRRDGNALANAKITVVGEIAAAGTIGGFSATGSVRISAAANASGVLPTTLVAAGPHEMVIAVAPMDVAVVPFDISATLPTAVNAPPMFSVTMPVTDGTNALDGARVELVPQAGLARAGISSRYFTADATGVVSGEAASGGAYDLYIRDPFGRAGSLRQPILVNAPVTSTIELPAPISVTGELAVIGNPNPLAGASVQILCVDCDGAARSRPLAEGVTDQAGGFTLTVAKPSAL
ncbi:MAG: hypothetical protein SFX73_10805 [Kofleriaceae bacterium]|nr:hypothetical protein [Kofleriaceae bacterium]